MGSIGDTTQSSEASSTVVAAALESKPIGDESKGKEELGNSLELDSDVEPPFRLYGLFLVMQRASLDLLAFF